jgi:chromosome segregation ATPase
MKSSQVISQELIDELMAAKSEIIKQKEQRISVQEENIALQQENIKLKQEKIQLQNQLKQSFMDFQAKLDKVSTDLEVKYSASFVQLTELLTDTRDEKNALQDELTKERAEKEGLQTQLAKASQANDQLTKQVQQMEEQLSAVREALTKPVKSNELSNSDSSVAMPNKPTIVRRLTISQPIPTTQNQFGLLSPRGRGSSSVQSEHHVSLNNKT